MGRILAATIPTRAGHLKLVRVFTSHLAMVLKALAMEGKGVAWIPQSLAAAELASSGKLAIAGDEEWTVAVQIVLIRPRTRMTELAEQFWSTVMAARK
jgi:DNA-binding transcriptional LysR family regulator